MADVSQIFFTYQEIAEALVKKQGIHEGIWGLDINFALRATNFGETERDLKPAAIVAVMQIGLHRLERETNLTVDAAKVNPRPPDKSKPKSKPN